MAALYSNASLYVTPSLYEGFGLTPLEALRFGTLPLVADAAALPEVVDDPDLRFQPGEPKDLANKILIFLNQPELTNRKLSEQRKRIECFSWDSSAKAYLCLLEHVGAGT
jgi:glycosyltransferase involved in cell wall biosynthesis